jgi:hypothetical protein
MVLHSCTYVHDGIQFTPCQQCNGGRCWAKDTLPPGRTTAPGTQKPVITVMLIMASEAGTENLSKTPTTFTVGNRLNT